MVVTSAHFPTLDNALVVETCWYSFLTVPFLCMGIV